MGEKYSVPKPNCVYCGSSAGLDCQCKKKSTDSKQNQSGGGGFSLQNGTNTQPFDKRTVLCGNMYDCDKCYHHDPNTTGERNHVTLNGSIPTNIP